MGELMLNCPLCCGEIFSCQKSLKYHLINYTENLTCPQCHDKFTNILTLVEHLDNTCQALKQVDADSVNEEICQAQEPPRLKNSVKVRTHSDSSSKELACQDECQSSVDGDCTEPDQEEMDMETSEEPPVTNQIDMSLISMHLMKTESGKLHGPKKDGALPASQMNMSLINMQHMKQEERSPSFQTQELKLVEEGGASRYVLVAHDGSATMLSQGSVVTKQNSDGTISFTSIKEESEPERDSLITQSGDTDDGGDTTEELYSCNTCGVSFTSVLDHIQNFHNDQDVVVEVREAEAETEPEQDTLTLMEVEEEQGQEATETQSAATRRVITETGDIVETHYAAIASAEKGKSPQKKTSPHTILEEEVVDKRGRLYTRRFVQIDKFWTENGTQSEYITPDVHPQKTNAANDALVVRSENGTNPVVYNCTRCNVDASSMQEFKAHKCKTVLKYSCPHCPVMYDNPKSLCAHMKVHKIAKQSGSKTAAGVASKPEDSAVFGPFRCAVCETVFPTNKSLRLHRRMHEPVKARPIDPPVQYKTEAQGSKDVYHCTQCDKWIHVGYRTVHQNFHRSTTQHNCDICNRKFHSRDYLLMHMNVHNIEKTSVPKSDKMLPYTCLYCNRQFARPHEKVKHERIHTGEKPHSCEICGKSFRVSYCLTLHMRTHTGARPYECQHCGKRFKAHSVYNHHLLTHSDVRAYKCPYCPKAFKTSVQLAGHKNSHTKPFSCTQCNRPFASLYAVRVHTETHRRQNNLKFSCLMCGASYARAFALKDHVRIVHQRDVNDSPDKPDNYNAPRKEWASHSTLELEVDPDSTNVPKQEDMQILQVETLAMDPSEQEAAMI